MKKEKILKAEILEEIADACWFHYPESDTGLAFKAFKRKLVEKANALRTEDRREIELRVKATKAMHPELYKPS